MFYGTPSTDTSSDDDDEVDVDDFFASLGGE
jgi:hypothetical protein